MAQVVTAIFGRANVPQSGEHSEQHLIHAECSVSIRYHSLDSKPSDPPNGTLNHFLSQLCLWSKFGRKLILDCVFNDATIFFYLRFCEEDLLGLRMLYLLEVNVKVKDKEEKFKLAQTVCLCHLVIAWSQRCWEPSTFHSSTIHPYTLQVPA